MKIGSIYWGATIIMFAMIAVSGMQLIFEEKLEGRNTLIVALSLNLGLAKYQRHYNIYLNLKG